MTGPGQTLFEFVRHWSRRWSGEDTAAEAGRMVLITEAVHAVTKREAATINALAREIGIDQSGASRLVKSAINAGYLQMRAASGDRRRREVAVTTAGHRMLAAAHRWQEEVFGQLTADWTPRQRADFQRAMETLLRRSPELEA